MKSAIALNVASAFVNKSITFVNDIAKNTYDVKNNPDGTVETSIRRKEYRPLPSVLFCISHCHGL